MFLISDLNENSILSEDNSKNRDNLFDTYKSTHFLMHSASPLINEVISIQKNMENLKLNESL